MTDPMYQHPMTHQPRRVPWWGWLMIVIGAVMLAVLVVGLVGAAVDRQHPVRRFNDPIAEGSASKYKPAAVPSVLTKKLGDTFTVDGVGLKGTLTVSHPEKVIDYQGKPCTRFTVEVTSAEGYFDYNQYDFPLQTVDGINHPANCVASGEDVGLHSGAVPAGQKVRGYLDYSVVPDALPGSKMAYAKQGTPLAYWQL